jgi:hypothetical protein
MSYGGPGKAALPSMTVREIGAPPEPVNEGGAPESRNKWRIWAPFAAGRGLVSRKADLHDARRIEQKENP